MSTDAAPYRLRVLTVNMHKGFDLFNRRFILHELREAIRAVGADVVFLQEVLGAHELHHARVANWPTAPQYEFMADQIWPEFAYGRNAVYPHGHHGNALLSRYPIVHYQNHDVSTWGPEKRALLHCEIQLPAGQRSVHMVCVHLGLREPHRVIQLGKLCELLKDEVPIDAPVVVAGDFNDWRKRAHDILAEGAGLVEVFKSAQGRAARTFPARRPVLELDRIYVRNLTRHVPLMLPRRPWSVLSDHAPLAADLFL